MSETTHICEVCFLPSRDHDDPGVFSPRCCHGCSCGVTAEPFIDERELLSSEELEREFLT